MASRNPGPLLTSLFSGSVNTIPPEFLAGIGLTELVQKDPKETTLSTLTGSLIESKIEQTLTGEVKKTDTSLTLAIPVTLEGAKLVDGQAAQWERTLDVGVQNLTPVFGMLEGQVDNLGNGKSILSTTAVESFPLLPGQDYDRALNILVGYTQQITPIGESIGDPYTEVTPINALEQRVRVNTPPTAELDAYVVSYPATTNLRLPDVLISIDSTMEKSKGEAEATEDGANTASGLSWSLSLSLGNTASASAAIIPNITPVIRSYWTDKLPVARYLFYIPSGSDITDILTKLAAFTGAAVSTWPVFQPEAINISLRGERASINATGHASTQQSLSPSSNTSGQTGGSGTGNEVSLSIRTVTIPPTLHDALTIGTPTDTEHVTATATMAITGTAGTASGNATISATVTGIISPSSIGATTPVAIPTSGLYLSELVVRPFQWGYLEVAAEVFDFATLA